MPVIVSMLRAVNLAAHNRIKMEALRALYESLGLRDVETYVQSGNIVFRTDKRDLGRLAKRIEDALERSFGFRSNVILRDASGLRDVIAKNPVAGRDGVEPGKFLVLFLAGQPSAEAREKVRQMKPDPEELWIEDREVYIHFPNGSGRSKLSWTAIEKTLKTPGTARNWNTVTKLLEMAERLEASDPGVE
jgi:uncharacterized protein (DUF1697 family)